MSSPKTAKTGTHVQLPKLGESVTEGTIGAWLKQVGDRVERYDPLVEITTDKVNAEVPSPVAGVIVEITAKEGETLPVGAEICVIDAGGDASQPAGAAQEAEPASTNGTAPRAEAASPLSSAPQTRGERPTGPDGEIELLRKRSSPAVRRIAEEHGIEIGEITGTGISGRVSKSDILRFIDQRRVASASAPSTPAQPEAPSRTEAPVAPIAYEEASTSPAQAAAQAEVFQGDTVVPLTALRRQVAEHMVRSERTAPHVTLWMEVDMTRVVQARRAAKERFTKDEGFDLTYLPFVIKAVVQALREHPNVNAVWDESRVIQRKAINIGVAVGMDEGLIVPVIRNADEKSIVGIARAARDLTTRAKENRLNVDDVQGGSFTVNNPGTFGTIMSTPIIVQPQSAILSTEAIVKRPVVIDDIDRHPLHDESFDVDRPPRPGRSGGRPLPE